MLTIFLGLLGLSLVVVVHELGHFAMARAVGVEVEAFSIGWGPRLFGWKRKFTEWRISVLPIGGYCKMKGEDAFRKAIDQKLPEIPREKGSFYGASPGKRILIALAGPLANVIFAIVIFSVVSLVGITIRTDPNKVILASESTLDTTSGALNPANVAGLKTGDTILSIDGKTIRDYSDLQEAIGYNPDKNLTMLVDRNGERLTLHVTPRLDKNSGAGVIGIYAWVDPVIQSVQAQSAADLAGIKSGDRIVSINGTPVRNTIDLLSSLTSKPQLIKLVVDRGGKMIETQAVLSWNSSSQSRLGISFVGVTRVDRAASLTAAMTSGIHETYKTFTMTLQSMGLLFRGINIFKAISGPARITYIIGNAANDSIKSEGVAGIVPILDFLAFLSVGLFFMNLLPIPVLDGGQIMLFLVEIARSRPLSTKTVFRFQYVGAVMIMLIFLVATFGDVLFFAGK
jgi:regulator of sigma E protease